MAAPYDFIFKVLFVGDSGVGKSSLVLRWAGRGFSPEIPPTIGVDFLQTDMNVGGKRVKLTLWDTAGAERFRTLTKSYYRGATSVILVYDVTRPETFAAVQTWLTEVELNSTNPSLIKMLIGNKTDVPGRRVTREEGDACARANGMMFMETSAKTGDAVQQALAELAQKIMDTPELLEMVAPRSDVQLTAPPEQPAMCGGMC
eukprot:Amastigsp_a676344_102.p1 type:complete len:202 gc:universal Amastigsp_a676344_102:668-63(-)